MLLPLRGLLPRVPLAVTAAPLRSCLSELESRSSILQSPVGPNILWILISPRPLPCRCELVMHALNGCHGFWPGMPAQLACLRLQAITHPAAGVLFPKCVPDPITLPLSPPPPVRSEALGRASATWALGAASCTSLAQLGMFRIRAVDVTPPGAAFPRGWRSNRRDFQRQASWAGGSHTLPYPRTRQGTPCAATP